jgi:DNA-binding Lrp family transcriptional regulator
MPAQPAIDSFDRNILKIYQSNTRLPSAEIGARVGLSTAAVQRRIKRLREAGVIRAEIAELDCQILGLGLTAIVHVDLVDESARALSAFRAKVTKHAEIQQCYSVTGTADYILLVIVADVSAYDAFCKACLLHDANVRSFTTHIVLDAVKRSGPLCL